MVRPDPLAWATRGWLLASAALAGVDAVFLGLELRLLRAIAAGDLHVDSGLRTTLYDVAARGEAIGWARLALFAPTALVYLVWLARAVRPHGEAMRISPTRAVFEYFVPLAQLALPYRTFGRLLAAADGTPRSDRADDDGAREHVADERVADRLADRVADERAAFSRVAAKADWTRFFWWSTWLATWLLAQLARSADAAAVDVAGFVQAGALSLGSALCAVVAGLAAERLVHRVTRATRR